MTIFRADAPPDLSKRIAMLRITEGKTNDELLADAIAALETKIAGREFAAAMKPGLKKARRRA